MRSETAHRDLADRAATASIATQLLWAGIQGGITCRVGEFGTVEYVGGLPLAITNAVISSRLPADVGEVSEFADALCRRGLPWSIQVRGAGPDGIDAIAARHGLHRMSLSPLMTRQLSGPPEVSFPPGLTFRPVWPDHLDLYHRTLAACYELEPGTFARRDRNGLWEHPATIVLVAEADGVPVATAMGTLVDDTVHLSHVAVVPGHRRRGYGTAVTNAVLRGAYATGARLAHLQPAASGASLCENMGFEVIEYWRLLEPA